jgi:hypothetical protein
MDEATRVLHRLERIGALDERGAPRSRLLDELRALVGEAEAWARLVDRRPDEAAGELRKGVEGMR